MVTLAFDIEIIFMQRPGELWGLDFTFTVLSFIPLLPFGELYCLANKRNNQTEEFLQVKQEVKGKLNQSLFLILQKEK